MVPVDELQNTMDSPEVQTPAVMMSYISDIISVYSAVAALPEAAAVINSHGYPAACARPANFDLNNFRMRKIFYAVLVCMLILPPAFAAQTPAPYWTVETCRTPRPYTIVRFYSAGHQQLMERRIEGKTLHICRKHVRRQLSNELEKFLRQQPSPALAFLNVY